MFMNVSGYMEILVSVSLPKSLSSHHVIDRATNLLLVWY